MQHTSPAVSEWNNIVALVPRAPLCFSDCSLQDHILQLTLHRHAEVKYMLKVWLEQRPDARLLQGGALSLFCKQNNMRSHFQ